MSGMSAGAAPARVVLVDDDASIRRLVALALEDLPVELVACADAAQARQALRDAPAALLLTDLMMPGESGMALLQMLAADPGLRGPAQLAVFSAGVDEATQAALDALGVWRVLHKPASMAQLQDCVTQALVVQTVVRTRTLSQTQPPAVQSRAASSRAAPDPVHDKAAAIERHFGGDAALFHAFHQGCLLQFAVDIAVGDAALAAGDLPALRRMGHSLSSVLQTLGHTALAAQGRGLDIAAAAGRLEDSAGHWQRLRDALSRL